MNKMLIKAEYLPIRCEICHKSDYFVAKNNNCLRCKNIENVCSNGKAVEIKRKSEKILNKPNFKLIIIMLLFSFFIGLATTQLISFKGANKFHHPILFELNMAACGNDISVNRFSTSDGKIVSRIMKTIDNRTIDEEIKSEIGVGFKIIDKKTLINANNKEEIRLVINSKSGITQNTMVYIVTSTDNKIIILNGPTLWHVEQFEYYLGHESEYLDDLTEYWTNKNNQKK
jgi:hypothetical protein